MKSILNISNGDCAVEIMKKAGIPGIFLPWRDVLHEGPVPDNLPLPELSRVRAQFITDRGWGTADEISESFIQRDNELSAFREYNKVILWFEHDLYDQQQLIQILDWFQQNISEEIELSIICTEQYLGCLSPEKWYGLLNTDTLVLPFLQGAVIRMLQEYPSCSSGLSRTAEQALKVLSDGKKHPETLFSCTQKLEERIFLGDAGFWEVLHELLESSPPLITLSQGKELTLPAGKELELSITSAGLKVLAGKMNWLDISPLERWSGGVHLKPGNLWCWDPGANSIVKRA
ncbi:hypothetical protein [Psychromonas aquimarina]|uniref:hypothetical protein n=1 Tax=Psychromonas aquimarina TaxID=444919 RepID=UPI000400B120|nr:hypothetical protein [Psychromonas aquimarina]